MKTNIKNEIKILKAQNIHYRATYVHAMDRAYKNLYNIKIQLFLKNRDKNVKNCDINHIHETLKTLILQNDLVHFFLNHISYIHYEIHDSQTLHFEYIFDDKFVSLKCGNNNYNEIVTELHEYYDISKNIYKKYSTYKCDTTLDHFLLIDLIRKYCIDNAMYQI